MIITATELRNNIGKYLTLASSKDIYITKRGKIIAMLTAPFQSETQTADDISDIDNRTNGEFRKEKQS
ncbi:MAG: type II toxin-antitoxin system prevent-host-death family antitoxin [Ruminococcus sp.]|nr:type II toxin-antitoxin system prevent-host-death family antitoxin [Ruminococcus sp.]